VSVENSVQYNWYRAKGSSSALLLLYVWIWNRKGDKSTGLQSIYRRGDGVLLSTRTHTHIHTEYSRGNKSINSLRRRIHVEVVRTLVLNNAVTKESIEFLLLPRPQQLKLDVTCNTAICMGPRQSKSRLRSPTNGNAVCLTWYCPAVALLYDDFHVTVLHFSRCLLLKKYCSLEQKQCVKYKPCGR
jgi:hypothetical protein